MLTEKNFDVLTALEEFAQQRGHTMLELAIGWLASHTWVSSVIAGATKPEQVEQNVAGRRLEADAGGDGGGRPHHPPSGVVAATCISLGRAAADPRPVARTTSRAAHSSSRIGSVNWTPRSVEFRDRGIDVVAGERERRGRGGRRDGSRRRRAAKSKISHAAAGVIRRDAELVAEEIRAPVRGSVV